MLCKRMRWLSLLTVALCAAFATGTSLPPAGSPGVSGEWCAPPDGDEKKVRKKKKKKKKKKNSARTVRWGQRRGETNAKYDKRFAKLLKRVRQDSPDDKAGGNFVDSADKPVRLWTVMRHPFIVRTDIDREFTANTAMYMEMLHREYGKAFKKILGVPASVKEKIEVIVFADRSTYMKNGGSPGTGGQFIVATSFQDRERSWPALHYRLAQYTRGETKFERWEKGTLKHEAAHMEMRMRLGMKFEPRGGYATWVESPNWYDEGQASIFEYWDFDKTVEENFEEAPNRGRYAPVVRRIHGTDKWKDFDYVWNISNAQWGQHMTTPQGFLNYCEAWSLAAYMMTGGKQGRRDFRAIFDLSKRVGIDSEGKKLRSWNSKFTHEDRGRLNKDWKAWVETRVSRDKRVPHEDRYLILNGYDPAIVDRLASFESDEDRREAYGKIREEEERRRKDPKRIER